MTRAIGPRVGMPPEAMLPLSIVGLAWVPVGLVASVWTAGHAASWATGHGWAGPQLTFKWGLELVKKGPAPFWASTPVGLIWGLAAAMVLVVAGLPLVLFLRWQARRPAPGDPLGSLAQPADVASLAPLGVATKAVKLRPSLAGMKPKAVPPEQAGLPLGLLRPAGIQLRSTWEDVAVVFMAPRSGKTSEVAVPQVLSAPGALVVTSNKSDLWAITAELRAKATGQRVWVFDPQRITHAPQTWWWNPLRGVTTVEAAQRLTSHFIAEVRGDEKREFWSSAAEDVLASLFLAAGSSGRTLAEVYDWLNKPTNPVPVDLLRAAGHAASASGLAGRQGGAEETREGVYETARTAAKCLRDPAIMEWVLPPPFDLDEFETAKFAATRETLYLLSKEAAGGAAPLVAAFADRVMQDATVLAERRGGRLDPPLVVVLDEAANICKIADLPQQYSHLGSRGIPVVTILQSYPQGVRVWGETGMDTLWAASTVKVIGAGLDDEEFLEKVSRLIGDHDVTTRGVHQGGGNQGENLTLRRQRILAVEDLRQLRKGTAILFATGCRPAMLNMQPWYRGPRKKEIGDAEKRALAGLTARAQAAGGEAPATGDGELAKANGDSRAITGEGSEGHWTDEALAGTPVAAGGGRGGRRGARRRN
jgi:type IV secretory pathway TraG/TraD family ATPase VirD4